MHQRQEYSKRHFLLYLVMGNSARDNPIWWSADRIWMSI